jgi:acyl-CoA synthetase (AMP-forming)/AMP-acid ligase II
MWRRLPHTSKIGSGSLPPMSEPSPAAFNDFLGLEKYAAQTPGATALGAPGRKPLTYAALWEHLQTIPRTLSRVGFRPGEVAAFVMPNGPELISAFLGISGIGAGAPLNPALTENEYRFYLGRLGARILVVADCGDSPVVKAADALGIDVLRTHSTPDDPAGIFRIDCHKRSSRCPGCERPMRLFCCSPRRPPPGRNWFR